MVDILKTKVLLIMSFLQSDIVLHQSDIFATCLNIPRIDKRVSLLLLVTAIFIETPFLLPSSLFNLIYWNSF